MLRSVYRMCRSVVHRISNRLDCPVVILLYHRVTSFDSDSHSLKVSPDNFRDQMRFLCENYPVLRFEADWKNVREPSIVVSFDDGYADNVLEALPILEEVGVPATFFIATGTIGSKTEFWFDELEFLVLRQRSFPPYFELKDVRYGRRWSTKTWTDRNVLFCEITPLIKELDFDRRENWMMQLRDWVSSNRITRESNRPMTVEELCALAESPVATIGAHGVTHSALAALSPVQQMEELSSSKKKLASWTGKNISLFAYPYGARRYYSRASIGLCNKVGFTKATTNIPGQVHRWTDPYQIPRQKVSNWPMARFAIELSKFWTN